MADKAQSTTIASLASIAKSLFIYGNRSEIIAATLVMAIVISMILPIPLWLLDVLIAVNISASCLLIVYVMQLRDTIQFSTFPALLLITTLFRVSLNVASTRQILLEGGGGDIIEAFGEVVVGGNIVVGLVVFIILTIVQFLVITKGSERVAEVGARFTLDAMPGKQLGVDIELKSGNITSEEAQIRRARIGVESQFFGAMDGALKFVKGDVVAGILITLTNLIGGVTIGIIQRGMSFGDAAGLYSVLAIGDALVTQIPALLTSIAAGLLITRISSPSEETSGHMGKQITQQLTSNPKAWMTASFSMAAFGLIPGMPWPVFLCLSALSFGYGFYAFRSIVLSGQNNIEVHPDFLELREFRPISPFLLRFAVEKVDEDKCLALVKVARRARNRLVVSYGMVAPAIETESEAASKASEVEFCHDEVPVLKMSIPRGHLVASCTAVELGSIPAKILKTEPHRWDPEKLLVWFIADDRAVLDGFNISYVTDWDLAEERFEAALFRLAPKHFGVEQASRLIKWLGSMSPDLAKELERIVPLQRFSEVLQRLLAERVSIRNVVRIAEILVEWGQRERDPQTLVECVRSGISREIANSNSTEGVLSAILLDPQVEEKLRGSVRQTAFGDYISLETSYGDRFRDSIFDFLRGCDRPSVIVLTSQDIRKHVRGMIQDRFEGVAVMSMPEVPSDFKINVVGVVVLEDVSEIENEAMADLN